MELTGRRAGVVGLGITNIALIRYLLRAGARVVACDQKSPNELGPRYHELQAWPITLSLGEGYLAPLKDCDIIFLTPGAATRPLPEVEEARRRGVPVTTEMDLFLQLCPARTVGVTGSSGKTTTTSLVGEILRADGRLVHVGGNIGRPLIDHLDEIEPSHWVVLELSSFQLELMEHSPKVALVTNLTPNHLDAHPSMEAYIAAKAHIYRFQAPQDQSIFNLDNDITRQMAKEAPSQVAYFSRRQEVPRGAQLQGDGLVLVDQQGHRHEVMRRQEIPLRGEHNVENVLAALATTSVCGARPAAMAAAVRAFRGVPHRLELVAEVGGVRYYNDSIATTPARAVAGLLSFSEPVVLIAGGYDKHLPFAELAEVAYRRARAVVLLGQAADKIQAALEEEGSRHERKLPVLRAHSLAEAVALASQAACPGDVVLLSPACASYDMFRNFEERGAAFRQAVAALNEHAAARA